MEPTSTETDIPSLQELYRRYEMLLQDHALCLRIIEEQARLIETSEPKEGIH